MYSITVTYFTERFWLYKQSLDLFIHIIGDHNVEVIQEKVRD